MRARRLFLAVPILVGTLALLAAASAPASTPSSSTVTVPSSPGAVSRSWTGTVLPGVNPTSSCAPPSTSAVDEHVVTIVVGNAYDSVNAAFKFQITWEPTSENDTSDLILTVIGPDGEEVDSSDGGSPSEIVNANNLPAGEYHVLACGFANVNNQPYNGSLVVTTSERAPEPSLPSAPAQGLAFSASVAADNQRDEAEPLLEIDKAGNVYDCGPTGFSNASDYAQVSPPNQGGDQFHMLGTPPRGQQGAGGGGDCGLAFGTVKNSRGNYQYAYTGLGPLTGFVSSTSPNNGKSLATGGPFANGVTDEGGGADRQWMTFVGEQEVLLIYNQQQPRNVVVQRSIDGGLTYSPFAERAARSPRFPGPIRYIEPGGAFPNGVVYFPWDRGSMTGNQINISFSTDKGATWRNCGGATAPGTTTLFVTADHDNAGNIYIVYGENAKFHTYMITTSAAKLVATCTENPALSSRLPDLQPTAFSAPVQVDRDAIRSTVFQWVTAGGDPGRVAVVFAGTETDGNPNTGTFDATWHIYVNQSLNATAADATFSQVKATTHPFHYDSICLNGLGCDLAIPPGDRSMADFFSLDYNPVDKKIYVTFNRSNKKPDEELGHIATPMVITQTGGPSLGGGTISSTRPVLRSSSADPPGDALSSYSTLAPGVVPADPPTTNEPAGDFLSLSIGPEVNLTTGAEVANGGFTATIKVADLSRMSLQNTSGRTNSQSLLWVLRFTNGYQDAAAAARWNQAQGFTFGYNNYTTGSAPCATTGPVSSDKCILYPGGTPIQGDVNQTTGTIRLSVPRSLLRALSGGTGPGERPTEVAATTGSRFFDATMFSLGNTVSTTQDVQSFLYPLDNTPAMDFLLPGPVTADLAITKSDSPDPVKGGQNLTYKVVVTNNGPGTATGVVMTDNLPKNAGFASVSTTKGTCEAKPAKATVTCNLGDMASGTSATITIVVKSPTKGPISNKASVTATSPDPNSSNNSDTETTTVTP
jgi:uncharacterized repeat protein (TIGR01451 family)